MTIRRLPEIAPGFAIGIAVNLAVGALLIAVILMAVWRENGVAVSKARDQVSFTLAAMTEQFGRITTDYGWWDEAYDKVVREHDTSWGDANFGEWLSRTADVSFVLVAD
ncbi:MAG: hypothetical protein K2X44_12230, partial [Magnetospirillum sp.]|nr:hypothetical protein [Magnetospirillum sp.]